MVARLRSLHSENREERFGRALRRWIEDPLNPTTDNGNVHVHPILVLLTAMAMLAGGTFLAFCWVQL